MIRAFRSRLFLRQFASFFLLSVLTFTVVSGVLLFHARTSLERQHLVLVEEHRKQVEQLLLSRSAGGESDIRCPASAGGVCEAFLVDADGRLLVDVPGAPLDSEGVRSVTRGQTGTGRYVGRDGELVFGSYAWLAPLQAGLVLEYRESAVMRPLYGMVRIVGLLALLFPLMGILLAYTLARSILSPVAALVDTADAPVLREYRSPAKPGSGTELDDLAHRFAAMQEAVRTREMMLRTQNDELRQQKAAVETASRLKRQFLSTINHELKTPLNVIIGFTTRVIRSAGDTLTAPQRENLEIVQEEARHLLEMIEDMLDYSQIVTGRREVENSEFDLALLVEEAAEAAGKLVEWKPIRIRTRFPADTALPCRSDRKRVRQILLHLLSNAVKCSERGTVTLTVEPSGEEYLLAVEDEGIGIPPEDREIIFEEFRQLDGSSSRKVEGTGLGLSITKRLTDLLGGRIHLESEPGKGSRFTVYLPVRRECNATESARGG